MRAQFYTYGNDPASVTWSTIETPTYRILYPRGADSLARSYALSLERAVQPVSSSIGYAPNAAYRKKMPVVLHNFTAYSNGMVTWMPRRMELLTRPEAYSPTAMPWQDMLAAHESRHVSQMQFANMQGFRFWNVLLGQIGTGAISSAYCGPAFDEGDAVATETALSQAGRGRDGSFLEYFRASFADGDYRNWWQWRYSSQKRFTPDHYKLGYITFAGMRTVFDEPDFTKRYYERISAHKGVAFNNFAKTVKDVSGLSFKDAFGRICEQLDSTWTADAAARGPFMESGQFSADTRLFTEYRGLERRGSTLFAIRSGIAETSELVYFLPDGSMRKVCAFSGTTSGLQYSPQDHRLYWSEYRPDLRWSLKSSSDIRYYDADGSIRTLTHGRYYYNPAPSPDGRMLAVTEYPADGGSRISLISSADGSQLRSYIAPDGLQVTESAWVEGRLYTAALSNEGFGIYEADGFGCVLAPMHIAINHLRVHGGQLVFTSDLNGVNELYSLDPADGSLMQLSSNFNGGNDFTFVDGDLYFTSLESDGRKIFKSSEAALTARRVGPEQAYRYGMAEKLSVGESGRIDPDFTTEISEPRNYSKLAHLFSFHSWAPVYFDYDSVSDLSFETICHSAGAGAMAFFQNGLSTMSGNVGVKLMYNELGLRPSAHAKMSYSGLYPIIELSADLNDRTSESTVFYREEETIKSETAGTGRPFLQAHARIYVPMNLSSGGWQRGFVPQARYDFSNDLYQGKYLSRAGGSVRAYAMKSVPQSCIYPRLGIGVELGGAFRPGLTDLLISNAYGFVYAYLPGIAKTHGIRISATAQKHIGRAIFADSYANTAPRGFGGLAARSISAYGNQVKLSFDYAMPFAAVDWTWLCPLAYIRNFELTPHIDLSLFQSPSARKSGSLYSAGADLAVRMGNLAWIPYDTRAGICFDYNGGQSFKDIADARRTSIRLLFSIDF